MPSVVVIPNVQLFVLSVVLLILCVLWSVANGAWSLFLRRRQHLLKWTEDILDESADPAQADTVHMPAARSWQRTAGPYDDITESATLRILQRGQNSYPFRLPHLDPVTPLPDVMRQAPRITHVVMRTGDWVECRDQYNEPMNEYSGLLSQVYEKIRTHYRGEWLVPKEVTGQMKIVRFKKVRPTDYPPLRHPRDLPDVRDIREMSPLA